MRTTHEDRNRAVPSRARMARRVTPALRARRVAAVVLTLSMVSGCHMMAQRTTGADSLKTGAAGAPTLQAAAPGERAANTQNAWPAEGSDPAPPVEPRNDQALGAPELYFGSGEFTAPAARRVADADVTEDGEVQLNFVDAEVREVIDAVLGKVLGKSYIIDPKVQGTVTARTVGPVQRDAVIPALENILAYNGAALTMDEGIYKVVTLKEAASGLSAPLLEPGRAGSGQGFGIHILPLEFVSAVTMADILKPFVGPERTLRADPARNLLIFAGPGPDARDLNDMVEIFDVDWMSGMSFGLFPLQSAEAKDVIADLGPIFLQDGASPLAGLVRFVPIERLNAILVISQQPEYLEVAEIWIERLDRGGDGPGRRIFVYYLQNGRAGKLADVLARIFVPGTTRGGQGPVPEAELAPGLTPITVRGPEPEPAARQAEGEGAQAAQPTAPEAPAPTPVGPRALDRGGIGAIGDFGNIRIIADEENNALVMLATPAEYRMIEATLRRLDIVPLQVLIEVTIAEVTLNDDLRYGLQWFFNSNDRTGTFSTLSTGDVASAFPGFSFVFNRSNARVVLNALTQITDVRVVSSPQLMVLDNQTARLQVGDQVPIATQSAVSVTEPEAPIVNAIEFRDTGVILEVTPRVNASGLVTLDVRQEVSDVIATTTSDLDSPTIQQRNIESSVAVQSGDTVALGGLIQDSDEESVSGIPLLSDIPILGHLFKTTNTVNGRTELLILITPRVLRDRRDAREITDELRRRMGTLAPLEQKIQPPAPGPAKQEG